MNLLQETKQLCQLYNIKPARSRGQNFLIKEEIYDEIIKGSELKKDDIVLEVGPGLGFLTAKLAEKIKKLIAVELDDKLSNVLEGRLIEQKIKNVKLINENILDITTDKLKLLNINKIVANLPYNITSVFLRKFLSNECQPKMMVLMLQKEVAERIVAKPGKMSLLAVSVQFYADSEILKYVPADNFFPSPEVDSAIIKLKIRNDKSKVHPMKSRQAGILPKAKLFHGVNEKDFFRLVKIGFSSKRKMLKNNLANGYHVSQAEAEERIIKAGFNSKVRAQELSVEDWKGLLGVWNF